MSEHEHDETPDEQAVEEQPERDEHGQPRTQDKSWPPAGMERKTPGPVETK